MFCSQSHVILLLKCEHYNCFCLIIFYVRDFRTMFCDSCSGWKIAFLLTLCCRGLITFTAAILLWPTWMCIVWLDARTYAGPTSLEKEGSVLLRPWHLPWESQCGLKGMCEVDFWIEHTYWLASSMLWSLNQNHPEFQHDVCKILWRSILRKWYAKLDSWFASMVSWRTHRNQEWNGWSSQNHALSWGWFRRLGAILLKLQRAQTCSKPMVSCIARVGHVHWCAFWCCTSLTRITTFGRPSEWNRWICWIFVLRAELLLKCELTSYVTQMNDCVNVWSCRRLPTALEENWRCFVKSRSNNPKFLARECFWFASVIHLKIRIHHRTKCWGDLKNTKSTPQTTIRSVLLFYVFQNSGASQPFVPM